MKLSHCAEILKPSPKGLTLYFFEVWDVELTPELFKIISQASEIKVSEDHSFPTSNFADHCPFLKKSHMVSAEDLILLQGQERVRVSMAGLVNLTFQGKIILIKDDKGKAKPIGGAYTVNKDFPLTHIFSSIKLEKENCLDLRFSISVKEILRLKEWFYRKEGRETSPLRELEEELCEENKILSAEDFKQLLK